jgi:hypothetical protein
MAIIIRAIMRVIAEVMACAITPLLPGEITVLEVIAALVISFHHTTRVPLLSRALLT